MPFLIQPDSHIHELAGIIRQRRSTSSGILTDQIVLHTERVRELENRIVPMFSASLEKLDRTRSVTLLFAKTKRRRRNRP
jgi:hypothetical protein